MLNAQQFNDGLLLDMQLEPFRQDRGWFGIGYYTSLIESEHIKDLAQERRQVREKTAARERSAGLRLGRILVSSVSSWFWGRGEGLKKKVL